MSVLSRRRVAGVGSVLSWLKPIRELWSIPGYIADGETWGFVFETIGNTMTLLDWTLVVGGLGFGLYAVFPRRMTTVIGRFWHRRKIHKLTDEATQLRNEVRGRSSETAPTTENLRQAQEQSRNLEEELAKERQEVEKLFAVASDHRHISEFHKHERDEKARELEEKTTELEERLEELAKCRESRDSLRYELGRWRIDRCGTDGEYRNKSVRVQFIDLADRKLAEQTKKLFSIAWRVEGIKQILLSSENPSPDHRVVIFSNDENVGGVRSAINEHNLLGERVTNKCKKPDMEDDVTIVIFPDKGSED